MPRTVPSVLLAAPALALVLGTLCAPASLAGVAVPPAAVAVEAGTVQVASAAALSRRFTEMGYVLAAVRSGRGEVPRVILANFPDDLVALPTVGQRKALFIQAMLPLILHANEEVTLDRERLLAILEKPETRRSAADRAWLMDLAEYYEADPDDPVDLVRRVDVVPLSLALAQAAEESGWGTSRFALEGNAVFGQWTFNEDAGLLPDNRAAGKTHYVRVFDGLLYSVAGYLHNLNTHPAYVAFRNRRQYMREHTGEFDSLGLANTLLYYSERRAGYVAGIREIIEANSLQAYDRAKLATYRPATILQF